MLMILKNLRWEIYFGTSWDACRHSSSTSLFSMGGRHLSKMIMLCFIKFYMMRDLLVFYQFWRRKLKSRARGLKNKKWSGAFLFLNMLLCSQQVWFIFLIKQNTCSMDPYLCLAFFYSWRCTGRLALIGSRICWMAIWTQSGV